jgi:hypothetical protein
MLDHLHHLIDLVFHRAIGGMVSVSRLSLLFSTFTLLSVFSQCCLLLTTSIDRSNGFEKEYFARQANKTVMADEAYKWSVEDM